jgi:hypothetical protein
MSLRTAGFRLSLLAATAGVALLGAATGPKRLPPTPVPAVHSATPAAPAPPAPPASPSAPSAAAPPRPSPSAEPAPTSPRARDASAAHLRAVVDAETGRLRAPRAGELAPQGLGLGVDARPSHLPEEILADGTILVPLDDRFLEFVSAHRASDGTIRFSCGPQPTAVPAAAPAAAPVWEVE